MEERQTELFIYADNPSYDAFVEKFKDKKTTDDCYTPQNVYDAIAGWVEREYSLDNRQFKRPFWPGGDYENENYPEGCVVVDNPPFSIRSQIIEFYCERGIGFFLFSPALTLLTRRTDVCHIATGSDILYENGATVITSFVTNLEKPGLILRTAPDLFRIIEEQNEINTRKVRRSLPKYEYPENVVMASMVQRWCSYGVEYSLQAKDCVFIRGLDDMKSKKGLFGGGYLVSEKAAAEKAAAEKAAAEKAAAEKENRERFRLSPREQAIVAQLSNKSFGYSEGSLFD